MAEESVRGDGLARLRHEPVPEADDRLHVVARGPQLQAEPPDVRVDFPKPAMDPAAAEAEIKRLKDELAKATAELERIRKRLAPPPGKP